MRRLRKKQESTFGYEPISADFGFHSKNSWLPGSLESFWGNSPQSCFTFQCLAMRAIFNKERVVGRGRRRSGASEGSMARPQGRVDMLQYQPLNSRQTSVR
jgi:hypothetical protein